MQGDRLCVNVSLRCAVVFRYKKFKKSATKPQPKLKPMFTELEVMQVMQLGYTRPVAVHALEACEGDANEACNLLLECGLVSHRPCP